MQILSSSKGAINLAPNDQMPAEKQTIETNFGAVQFNTIIAADVQLWYITIAATVNDTLTITASYPGFYLLLSLENTFISSLTGISTPLYEHCFFLHYTHQLRADIEIKQGNRYTGVIMFIPFENIQHITALQPFINDLVKGKHTTINNAPFVAPAPVLVTIEAIKHKAGLLQQSALMINDCLQVVQDANFKVKRLPKTRVSELYKLTAFIRANLTAGYPVQEYINLSGVTEYTVWNYFAKLYGQTIHEHINEQRFLFSIPFLLITDYVIDHIAKVSGFASTKTYTRTFKRLTGVTPSQYRADKFC